LEEAHSLEEMAEWARRIRSNVMSDNKHYVKSDKDSANPGLESLFLHPRLVLPEFPAITAPPEALAKIKHGAAVNLPYFRPQATGHRLQGPQFVRVFADQTRLVAIARQVAGTLFHPKVVLI
jgi:hypothetical protein